jgi:hypothetical protein
LSSSGGGGGEEMCGLADCLFEGEGFSLLIRLLLRNGEFLDSVAINGGESVLRRLLGFKGASISQINKKLPIHK